MQKFSFVLSSVVLLYLVSLCVILIASSSLPGEDNLELQLEGWKAHIQPKTFSIRADMGNGDSFQIADAGLGQIFEHLHVSPERIQWDLPEQKRRVVVQAQGHRLAVTVTSQEAYELEWPKLKELSRRSEIVIPSGEGLIIPSNDPFWKGLLPDKYCQSAEDDLSLAFFAIRKSGRSFTYIFDDPSDTEFCLNELSHGFVPYVTHNFGKNDAREFRILIIPGDGTPLAPAKEYREWLQDSGQFISLQEKMARSPALKDVLGASQLSLWDGTKTPTLIALMTSDDQSSATAPLNLRAAVEPSSDSEFLVHGVNDVFDTMLGSVVGDHKQCARCSLNDLQDFFLKPISVTEEFKIAKYSPRFHLPLFQAVFHDAVVTTDYSDLSLLKIPDVARERALIWQLYNLAPLWNLDAKSFKKNEDFITRHHNFYSHVQRASTGRTLTDFTWRTEDRLIQEAQFGENVKITANFSAKTWKDLPPLCVRAEIHEDVEEYCPPIVEANAI